MENEMREREQKRKNINKRRRNERRDEKGGNGRGSKGYRGVRVNIKEVKRIGKKARKETGRKVVLMRLGRKEQRREVLL